MAKGIEVKTMQPKPSDFPRDRFRDCTIDGLDFVDTCTSHPEQYDVFAGTDRVGYLRLRSGWFVVRRAGNFGIDKEHAPLWESPHPFDPDMFDDEYREYYLTQAALVLRAALDSPRCTTCGGDTCNGRCNSYCA